LGVFLYADDIALLSASCSGLQKMTDICAQYGKTWDITFNPQKTQVITFARGNPTNTVITMSDTPVLWANKVKYLGVSFYCKSVLTDLTNLFCKFYSQFNNISSVIGKGYNELMNLQNQRNSTTNKTQNIIPKAKRLGSQTPL